MFFCGPAKGTEAEPYRCICCRRTFSDIEQMAVSICYSCMGDDPTCKSCRARGVFVSDFRVGGYVWQGDDFHYEPDGGLGHRLKARTTMVCGVKIPQKHWGNGSAVVPPCPVCWPDEYGA